MQTHNVPQYVELLKKRKFPIDGMQIEVIANVEEARDFKGIITMNGEDQFSLSWCKRDCFLLLFSSLDWKCILNYWLPYCLGLRKLGSYEVCSTMGERLHVVRFIKYKQHF